MLEKIRKDSKDHDLCHLCHLVFRSEVDLFIRFIKRRRAEQLKPIDLVQSDDVILIAVFVQVLNGDIDNAICLHAFYYAIWKRFGALPERYNWQLQAPDVLFYPLRPELVESTYLLYQVSHWVVLLLFPPPGGVRHTRY